MSRTTVLGITPESRPVELLELRNAFGWAPSIWQRLLGGEIASWLSNGDQLDELWRSIEELPAWKQVPLVLTFDTGVIPGEEAIWAANQLDEFERRIPGIPGHVNHVPAMADFLRTQPEAPFIGVWSTSASSNSFDPWNEEANEPGTGLPLDAMYLLERHRDQVAT